MIVKLLIFILCLGVAVEAVNISILHEMWVWLEQIEGWLDDDDALTEIEERLERLEDDGK